MTRMRLPAPLRGNFVVTVIFISTMLYLALPGSYTLGDEPDRSKLVKLQEKIRALQDELQLDNRKKDKAVYELKQAEEAIAESSRHLRAIQSDLSDAQQQYDTLAAQERDLSLQLDTNRKFIIEQTRTAYALGKQQYIKLLLNQQDPSRVSRMVVYYQYFNRSRTQRMNQINDDIVNLNKLESRIDKQAQHLKQLQQQGLIDKKHLEASRMQRQQIVASLSAKLKSKDKTLQALLRDEQHLKKLLNRIQELDDVQLDLSPPREFSQLKGQLPWPAQGKLLALFGTNRENTGNLKWQGALIQTQPGQTVHAIAYGRVVFADWLRGFGMLLIVDHGKGYMSLYGHNEQLYKKLGDWVQANDVIAVSGNSGGHSTISLYFEIRHKGVPVNPAKWCKPLAQRTITRR